MLSNKLSLIDVEKTKNIILCSKYKSTNSDKSIKIGHEAINPVRSIKNFLDNELRLDNILIILKVNFLAVLELFEELKITKYR